MTFIWPDALWLLAAIPALVAAYVLVLRRRRKAALRYASLSLVRQAAGPSWRRHVPPALFLAAVAAMLLAVARPAAIVTLPAQQDTVILAIDVSGSMSAEDVKPNRLAAAQAAAKQFIADQPSHTRIGIVAFSGSAALVQPPTRDHAALAAAVDRLEVQQATAIGSGILVSLKAIFPNERFDWFRLSGSQWTEADGASSGGSAAAPRDPATDAQPGSYSSAAVVLLTDGQTTVGPDPIKAAKVAARHGVRVFTVGMGTAQGEVVHGDGWSMRVRLDERTLQQIAGLTRGEYFQAGSAEGLKKVYRNLNSRLVMVRKEREIGALFAAAAAALAIAAAGLSLAWFGRIL